MKYLVILRLALGAAPRGRVHDAIDIMAAEGTPVVSAAERVRALAAEARRRLEEDSRGSALFRDDEERESGPHMLNRSFSGTYER